MLDKKTKELEINKTFKKEDVKVLQLENKRH